MMFHKFAIFFYIVLLENPVVLLSSNSTSAKKGVGLSSSSLSSFQCGDIEVLSGISWYYDWQDINR